MVINFVVVVVVVLNVAVIALFVVMFHTLFSCGQ